MGIRDDLYQALTFEWIGPNKIIESLVNANRGDIVYNSYFGAIDSLVREGFVESRLGRDAGGLCRELRKNKSREYLEESALRPSLNTPGISNLPLA